MMVKFTQKQIDFLNDMIIEYFSIHGVPKELSASEGKIFGNGFRRALDHLDAMMGELEEKHVGDNWIKVEDRLPEDKQDVIFIVSNNDNSSLYRLNGKRLGGSFEKGTGLKPRFITDYLSFWICDVSYWMPMPGGPGEVG